MPIDEYDVAQWEKAKEETRQAIQAYRSRSPSRAKPKEVIKIVFTPWPLDTDGNDLSRISLSSQDAWTLHCLAAAVEDKCPEEQAAADRLTWALRDLL